MTTQTNIPYNKLKVPKLKALCRERELWGYSRKKKSELIDCLNRSDVIGQGRAIQPVPEVLKRTIGVQTEWRRNEKWEKRRREKRIENEERKRIKEERRKKEEEKKKEGRRRKNKERRKRKKKRKKRKEKKGSRRDV